MTEEELKTFRLEAADHRETLAKIARQRAQFAAMILQGLQSNPNVIVQSSSCGWKICNADEATLAAIAVSQADALIKELKK